MRIVTRVAFDRVPINPTATLVLGEVNRRRRVKVESESDGEIYDQAPLRIGTSNANIIRQVDPAHGEEFMLGPGQQLWAISTTGAVHNLHYTVEDSVDDKLYTDDGSSVEGVKPRGGDAEKVSAPSPAPGTGRSFKTG